MIEYLRNAVLATVDPAKHAEAIEAVAKYRDGILDEARQRVRAVATEEAFRPDKRAVTPADAFSLAIAALTAVPGVLATDEREP